MNERIKNAVTWAVINGVSDATERHGVHAKFRNPPECEYWWTSARDNESATCVLIDAVIASVLAALDAVGKGAIS